MKIIEQFPEKIKGVFSTFDRMIIKGHYIPLHIHSSRMNFLFKEKVLLKDFAKYAESLSGEIKQNVASMVKTSGRPYIYLNSPKISKEETAKKLLKDNPMANQEGLVCIIGTLETCKSLEVCGDKALKKLVLKTRPRKCMHYYFYYYDREFGWMHVKIQTWFPFEIQIYINGREYISKQLDKENIKYTKYDNCFTDIENIERAQEIAKKIESKDWSDTFDKFAHEVNPVLKKLKASFDTGYYWCVDQCEYATDIMFNNRKDLEEIYPALVEHALINFSCEDVMVFLGRKMHPLFRGEVASDVKKRFQGVRIKHKMKKNSIKMYDKYSVLRIETTINQPKEFKIYKEVTRKGNKVMAWAPMGKSISNLYRYAQVSEAANKRYIDALSLTNNTGEQVAEIEKLSESLILENKSLSGFNLLSANSTKIFAAVLNGSNYINGFRNKDILTFIYPKSEDKKLRNKVTRLLAKLKAFGLIYREQKSFKYKATVKGIKVMAAILKIKKRALPFSL